MSTIRSRNRGIRLCGAGVGIGSSSGWGEADKDGGRCPVQLLLRRQETLSDKRVRRLLRGFVLEMLVYAALVVGYVLVVLRLLGDPLKTLFGKDLTLYGLVGLALIVAQGVLLDAVTTFIIRWSGLDTLE